MTVSLVPETLADYLLRLEVPFDASELTEDAVFDAENPQWANEDVQVIAVAAELNIAGHDSSREEIEAFRDKSAGQTCAKQDCSARDGSAHSFPYVDDLSLDAMDTWKVRGTPTYFVIQPDGIIAWTSDNTARYADAGELSLELEALLHQPLGPPRRRGRGLVPVLGLLALAGLQFPFHFALANV